MANLSDFLAPVQGPRPTSRNAPGSNGYWRRKAYGRPGAYTFIAPKTGRYKIVGLGAGTGGRGRGAANVIEINAGSGGGLSVGEFNLVKGDVLLITVGAGSLGTIASGTPADGGTTTIICAARGINMVIPGGRFSAANVRPTGGNLINTIGGNSTATNQARGGASSGTLTSDGFASQGPGGSGWGGPSSASVREGTSSNTPEQLAFDEAIGSIAGSIPAIREFWDFEDLLGNASNQANTTPAVSGQAAGGAANSGNSGTGGPGGIGGGGGAPVENANNVPGGPGGLGGGGSSGNVSSSLGGKGGDGFVLIHWDEVI